MMEAKTPKWAVEGCDRFSYEWYPLKEFDTEAEARAFAAERDEECRKEQPGGMPDRAYVREPGELRRADWPRT